MSTAIVPNVLTEVAQQKFKRRKLLNQIALTLAMSAMLVGLVALIWVLFDVFRFGFGGLSAATFTETTPTSPDETGGLLNAIYGSFMMVALATLVFTPIGIMAGIYLAEFDKSSLFSDVVRFMNDILLSAPSIIIGLFVYTIIVAPTETFSGFAGSAALGLLVIPVVIRATENMLNLIPTGLREAAYALGTPKWKVILSITIKAARAGLVTGLLLAVARIFGETAPLLFTALNQQFLNYDASSAFGLAEPMSSLPVTIYAMGFSPYEKWVALSWVAILVITVTVLAINIFARFITRKN